MTGHETRKGVSLLNGTGWTVNPSTGIISLNEEALQQIINPDPIEKWYILDQEPLARGQFAVVYHCYHRMTGVEYAAKFSSRWRFGTDCMEDLLHEIAVCALLESQTQAVQLIDVFSTAREIVLVMEYAPGGDLQTLLDEELVPYEHDVVSFIRQLLEVLVVIHDKNLVHLDIKPQNLVLMGEFPDCKVKLCDFEISRMLTKGHEIREILGTPDYVAPEILHYEPITVSTDMWSVGVLTYVLLTGFLPFGGENDQETFLEISRCDLDFPSQLFEDVTPEAIDFIKNLLLRQPERRMTADGSLMHSWIRNNVKRPTPPNSLNLTHINSPAREVEKFTTPNVVHISAERSLSCPLSDSSETPEENQKEDISTQKSHTPLYPNVKQKSFTEKSSIIKVPAPATGNLLTSPSFQRSDIRASRQNLERLKSLSKSREVLSGKVQMSNLKKCQSKSRERIVEAKFGFSKSHEQLMALRSLSQSVEALSVLSRLQQANTLCSSCNNLFSHSERLNISEEKRMYQSLAAIDQIDTGRKVKKNQYDSTVSLNTEIYNDLLTQRNTNMNCKLGDIYHNSPKQSLNLKSNVCKGGRDVCENKCVKSKKSEHEYSQGLQKSEKQRKDTIKTNKERKSSDKTTRLRDQRRRSSSTTETESVQKTVSKSSTNSMSSVPIRRGSVSHVEQRLLERQERQQERKQREKNSVRRKSTSDYERNTQLDKSKLSKSADKIASSRSKKNTRQPKKHSKPLQSPFSSDVSEASSLESVEALIGSPEVPSKQDMFVVPIVTITNDCEFLSASIKEMSATEPLNGPLTPHLNDFVCAVDKTEINITELEPKPSMSKKSEHLQDKSNISVSERIQNFEKVSNSSASCKPQLFCSNMLNHKNFVPAQRLDIINEEENMSDKSDSKLGLSRSISTSSEVGSVSSSNSDVMCIDTKRKETRSLSCDNNSESDILNTNNKEGGNLSSDIESFVIKTTQSFSGKGSHFEISNFTDEILTQVGKSRSRSFSVHATVCDVPKITGRSRSKSFNYNNPPGMPWGSLCNGAIARAFGKFNFTDGDISPSISPRNASPTLLSSVTDQVAVSH